MYELIDPGLTHSYICTALVDKNNFLVLSTDNTVKVTNPLSQCVLVNQLCRSCSLKIKGYEFPTSLMLLSFNEFDVILGIDWLTMHNAVVNCRQKTIELKCQNNEIIRIESDESCGVPIVISSMSA